MVRLRGPLSDYELRPSIEAGLDEFASIERIVDRGEVGRLLRRLLDEDPISAFRLRGLALEVGSGWTHDNDLDVVSQLADAVAMGALLLTRRLRPISTSEAITRIEQYEPAPLEPFEELEVYLRVYSEDEEWPSLEVDSEAEEWPSVELRGEVEELGFSLDEPRKPGV